MEEKTEKAVSTENENIIPLEEAILTANKFISGEMTEDQLSIWGIKISVKPYIPTMDKLRVMMQVTQNAEYSIVDTLEIKTLEFYKSLFFDALLEYTNIDNTNEKLHTFVNYDLLYPILSSFILQYCEKDYNMLVQMIKDTINFYNIKETNESLKDISVDALEKNNKANKKLVDSLTNDKDMVKDLKDIMIFNDPTTQKVVEAIKKQSLEKANESIKEKTKKETIVKKSKGRPKKVVDLE